MVLFDIIGSVAAFSTTSISASLYAHSAVQQDESSSQDHGDSRNGVKVTRLTNRKKQELEHGPATYHLDISCDSPSRKRDQVHGTTVVLRDKKLWLVPRDAAADVVSEKTPLPTRKPEAKKPTTQHRHDHQHHHHPFTGFTLHFDTDALKAIPGLVSTISPPESEDEAPLLNWIYVDGETLEVKYGSRADAEAHTVGPFEWTHAEGDHTVVGGGAGGGGGQDAEAVGLTLEGWEGFVAVEEKRIGKKKDGQERSEWALYWDRDDDGLGGGAKVGGKRVLNVDVERRAAKEKAESKKDAPIGRVLGEEEGSRHRETGGSRLKWY
ncbi:hypothetical protein LTS18_008324 [Coniosporium uncinatum]|uniref:Uncharacterized protein n=1 Tax=Coniosporium uncinatum TaxID=93489 RepID=A0ACC3DNK5_9PEZI|nr:hypothetical protein LTS18_008324 [Coniosporium uncinatum]